MQVFVAQKIYAAAVAAVAAVRSAGGLALVRLERIHAVAAVARLYGDLYFIGKHLVVHMQEYTNFFKKRQTFLLCARSKARKRIKKRRSV